LDLQSKFKLISACGKRQSHKSYGKSGYVEVKAQTKCSLKV
jgi:hypothetical protein